MTPTSNHADKSGTPAKLTDGVVTLLNEFYRASDESDEDITWAWTDRLVDTLAKDRAVLSADQWDIYIYSIRAHPMIARIREDPFTGSAYQKNRGYPGDASVIDYIYGHPSTAGALEATTAFGRALNRYTFAGPASRAVRNRRDLLTGEIDRVCLDRPLARVFSVACGHLREASASHAVRKQLIGELVAIDQDDKSIALVKEEFEGCALRTITAPISILLGNRSSSFKLETFDFIYSAGLYDYLPEKLATRLTSSLISLLRPGGKLWLSNFAREIRDRGYMEACLDWWLVYRDEHEMESLLGDSSNSNGFSSRTFREHEQNIVFLEVQKT